MRTIRIGNLGAGVQSTTCYLLESLGIIDPVEAWIFADTGEEPQVVYRHLEWLESLGGTRIIRASLPVKLGDQLSRGMNATGRQRFMSIPAFTAKTDHVQRLGKIAVDPGITRRQCTREYKIDVIEQCIRREIVGLKKRERFPKDLRVQQIYGLSDDEPRRIRKVRENYRKHRWASPVFPLAEMGWTRAKCVDWLRSRVPHETPRSACVFCPYRSPIEWERLKLEDPPGWARAVEIDNALRVEGNVANRGLDQRLYVHRHCIPLEMVDVAGDAARERAKPKRVDMFGVMHAVEDCNECSAGMCGV